MNTSKHYKRTKLACYTAYFTMSSIFSLPPLLFVTLRETYDISYTLLGTLVLTNFCTQLAIDLIFTFFTKHFNIAKVVKIMPLITSTGLLIYAIFPAIFPQLAYVGLLIGTVIFSVSAGLSEVLLSPMIAAIPSDNPQRDMSFLHSLYAFGVFTVVLITTLFLNIFGTKNWMYLTIFFALLPIIASVLFIISPMPDMNADKNEAAPHQRKHGSVGLLLCVLCIFFGSCAENTMSNWISGYMENALHIDKSLGDILGMAMFAILLGLARISYAKFGKNINRVLFGGMAGAFICYLIVGVSENVILAFIACILTGLFTAMLWPGTLIMMEEKLPEAGVTAFAMMAAGGDFGASLAPQLLRIIADHISLKTGMLICSVFPALGVIVLLITKQYFKRTEHTAPAKNL